MKHFLPRASFERTGAAGNARQNYKVVYDPILKACEALLAPVMCTDAILTVTARSMKEEFSRPHQSETKTATGTLASIMKRNQYSAD